MVQQDLSCLFEPTIMQGGFRKFLNYFYLSHEGLFQGESRSTKGGIIGESAAAGGDVSKTQEMFLPKINKKLQFLIKIF